MQVSRILLFQVGIYRLNGEYLNTRAIPSNTTIDFQGSLIYINPKTTGNWINTVISFYVKGQYNITIKNLNIIITRKFPDFSPIISVSGGGYGDINKKIYFKNVNIDLTSSNPDVIFYVNGTTPVFDSNSHIYLNSNYTSAQPSYYIAHYKRIYVNGAPLVWNYRNYSYKESFEDPNNFYQARSADFSLVNNLPGVK